MRWLVGDIQGCAREFEDLVERIAFDPSRDELWSVGDLINRGPDSLAALRLWRDLGGKAVLGNHDVYALLARSSRRPRKNDTLDALFAAADCDELLDRVRACGVLARLPSDDGAGDVWAVHAGVDPRWDDLDAVASRVNDVLHDDDWLGSSDVCFATRVRCCDADGRSCRYSGPPEGCPGSFRPWDEWYRGELPVVHGHWARRGYYRGPRAIGLDSGCVYGGTLTAWCQQEDRIVQVPSRLQGRGPTHSV